VKKLDKRYIEEEKLKHKRIFRILAVALTLALLVVAIPASPVMAQTIQCIPNTGTIGTLVTIAGQATPGVINQAAFIFFNMTGVGYGSVGPTGAITGSFTVPANATAGAAIITVHTTPTYGIPIAYGSFTVTEAQIVTSPSEGYAGDTITVSGTGFAANSGVTITFDDAAVTTSPASVTTDTLGSFTDVTFTIPASARGSHTIKAEDATGRDATATFTTLPKITVTPDSGGVGDQVTVSGTGFAGSSSVTITFDDATVTTDPASVTTNPSGSFTAKFTVPAAGRGAHEVKAWDASVNYATATFTIGTKASVTPTTGFVGDQVTVSGNGFGANKSVTITFDGTAVTTSPASVTTNPSGSFSATFLVPNATNGAHTVKAEESATVSATATFTVQEKMSISQDSGFVGDEVSVSGSGFAGSSTVTIYFDDTSVGTATTSASGSFDAATFTVPASINGSHTIKVQDASDNSETATFTIEAEITDVTPTSGFVGDQVAVSGTGFGGNRSVTLYLDNVSIGTGTTDAIGNLSVAFTIPARASGSHSVKAQDSVGNSATATLTVEHKMAITPTTGITGTTVSVTGSGFGANSQITIKFNNSLVSTSPIVIMADANGGFSGSFALPASPAGTYTVEVSDGTSSSSANFTAVIDTTIDQITSEVSPGNVGMELTISGTGFKANASVTVTYESEPEVLKTTTTDSGGSFSVTFTIPESVGGEHTITVSDGETAEQFVFVMESILPQSPVLLLPEMGFKPKQPVSFDWDWADANEHSLPVIYTLQIATDDSFTNIVLERTGLTESEYTMTEEEKLESRGAKEPYYWRVRAIDSAENASLWAGADTFNIGFIWPGWIIYVWIGLGVLVIGLIAFWLGRRFAYASY